MDQTRPEEGIIGQILTSSQEIEPGTLQHSETTKDLDLGILGVQSKIETLKKNADNPYFKSRYTDLATGWEMLRPLLAEQKIIALQVVGHSSEKDLTLTLRVIHAPTGQYYQTKAILHPVPSSLSKEQKDVLIVDPQAEGSAITYMKRYQIFAFFGLVSGDEDDDGNKGSRRTDPQGSSGASSGGSSPKSQTSKGEAPKAEAPKDSSPAQDQGSQQQSSSGGQAPRGMSSFAPEDMAAMDRTAVEINGTMKAKAISRPHEKEGKKTRRAQFVLIPEGEIKDELWVTCWHDLADEILKVPATMDGSPTMVTVKGTWNLWNGKLSINADEVDVLPF